MDEVAEPPDAATDLAQLAELEARFRAANAAIGRVAAEFDLDQQVPFICECARRECTTLVRVLLSEYERQRARGCLLYAAGHEHGIPGIRPVDTVGAALLVMRAE